MTGGAEGEHRTQNNSSADKRELRSNLTEGSNQQLLLVCMNESKLFYFETSAAAGENLNQVLRQQIKVSKDSRMQDIKQLKIVSKVGKT